MTSNKNFVIFETGYQRHIFSREISPRIPVLMGSGLAPLYVDSG